MDSKIETIIFDFGGVLVNLDKQATIDAFAGIGYDAASYIGTYAQKGPFAPLELGQISAEDFIAEIRHAASPGVTQEQVCDAWNCMLTDIPDRRLQTLLDLKARYRLVLLSNTNDIHWIYSCRELFTYKGLRPEDYFERLYLSFECKMAKPDPAFFRYVIDDLKLDPRTALFVDDSSANCLSAAGEGLSVFHSEVSDDWLALFK